MPDRTAAAATTASSIVVAMAIAALTTAGASAAVATLLTGSPSPSAWLRSYQHAQECRQAGALNDPNCSAAAAEAITKLRIAAEIESKSRVVARGGKSAITHTGSRRVPPPPQVPQPYVPVMAAPRPPSDDAGGGVDG